MVRKFMGLKRVAKKHIGPLANFFYVPLQAGKGKVFCISMQRNGTTSCGDFLADFGFRVARDRDAWINNWSWKWVQNDFQGIFSSIAFRSFQAYEDGPWWMPKAYEVLHQRFPSARFILFFRDGDEWFDSMVRHSAGKTPGNTYRHCLVYRRLPEYYDRLQRDPGFSPTANEVDNLLELDDSMREHYKEVYSEYNRDVRAYFSKNAPDKLFVASLASASKWRDLGAFLQLDVTRDYDVHANRSLR